MPVAKPGPGESLAEHNPELSTQLHPTLNGTQTGWDVKPFSSKKMWWLCPEKGHVWKATVANRSNGNGCRGCSGQMLIRGENDLETREPQLAKEWHPVLNLELRPCDVMPWSMKRIWWSCPVRGHGAYVASASHRSGGRGCPVCRGMQVRIGVTDVATQRPSLNAEFHPTKNPGVSLYLLTLSSAKQVWWRCTKHGHEWRAPISKRVEGHGCPYCSGHRILIGFNDLCTVRPEIAEDLHPTRNGGLTGHDFTEWSNKRPWWLCSDCGHEWQTSVGNRSMGKGCQACALRGASKIEGRLRDWLRHGPAMEGVSPDGAKVNVPWRRRKTMDIDVSGTLAGHPDVPVAVEYDGSYWHALGGAEERDLDKTKALLGAGYLVVRVRETAKKNKLQHLPLVDPNLLQLDCTWEEEDDEAIYNAVDHIESWLKSKITAP